MKPLLGISRAVDWLCTLVGKSVMWLILAAILVSAANAVSRKLFDLSSNAWLELQWYLFGAAYMLAASYTLLRNEHIRIDVISTRLPPRLRNWIDLLGHLIVLMPFTLLMIREQFPSMMNSWRIGESSSNYGGLIVWPAKAIILAGFALLALQAVSEIIKRTAVLLGAIPDPYVEEPVHRVLPEGTLREIDNDG